MHKLSRGKTVLIYAMAKRGTQTRTDAAAVFYTWLIFSINVCIVYNMYTEDNANSSPKNNTPVGLCIIFFRFVLFASFPPDVLHRVRTLLQIYNMYRPPYIYTYTRVYLWR